MNLLLEITELYFDYIDVVYHCLFQKRAFVQDLVNGDVPESILFAIVGLAARFSTNPFFAGTEPRERGRAYMEEAERRLSLRNISMETAQLSLLLAAGATGDGLMEARNLYLTVSCRTAQLLRLPHRDSSSLLEQEIHTRSKSERTLHRLRESSPSFSNHQ
jgi:hypothetical protein